MQERHDVYLWEVISALKQKPNTERETMWRSDERLPRLTWVILTWVIGAIPRFSAITTVMTSLRQDETSYSQ